MKVTWYNRQVKRYTETIVDGQVVFTVSGIEFSCYTGKRYVAYQDVSHIEEVE